MFSISTLVVLKTSIFLESKVKFTKFSYCAQTKYIRCYRVKFDIHDSVIGLYIMACVIIFAEVLRNEWRIKD